MNRTTFIAFAVFLAQLSYILAETNYRGIEYLNYDSRGSVCAPVYAAPGTEAFVEVSIRSLSVKESIRVPDQLAKYEIPTLIIRRQDLMKLTNGLDWYSYDYKFVHDDLALSHYFNNSTRTFNVDVEGEPIDSLRYFNGHLSASNPINFPVSASDVYCVFISPPRELGIQSLNIPVVFKNSYGYLSYPSYVVLQQAKLAMTILFIEAALILLAAFKYRKKSQLSEISKPIIFYVFLPFFSLNLLELVSMLIKNKVEPTRLDGVYFLIKTVILFLRKILYILVDYWILLFAMGYGVVYLRGLTNLKSFPSRLLKFANSLLTVNIGVLVVDDLIDLIFNYDFASDFPDALTKLNPYINDNFLYTVEDIARFLMGIFPIVWFSFVCHYFLETKKVIGLKSKKKFTITIVAAILIEIGAVLFQVAYAVTKGKDPSRMAFSLEKDNWPEIQSRFQTLEDEAIFNYGQQQAIFWAQDVNIQLLILVFYFFWIRDNSGLKTKDSNAEYELVDQSA